MPECRAAQCVLQRCLERLSQDFLFLKGFMVLRWNTLSPCRGHISRTGFDVVDKVFDRHSPGTPLIDRMTSSYKRAKLPAVAPTSLLAAEMCPIPAASQLF
jgi:hypothetical protein